MQVRARRVPGVARVADQLIRRDPLAVAGVLVEGLDLVVLHTPQPLNLSPVRARPLLARLRKGNAALVAVNDGRGTIAVGLNAHGLVTIDDPGHGLSPEEISAIHARLARGGHRDGGGIGLALTRRFLAEGAVVIAAGAMLLVWEDAPHTALLGVTGALGLAMGAQAATARALAVKDVTTVVITSTITGLAMDSRLAGGTGALWPRRLLAVLLMLTL